MSEVKPHPSMEIVADEKECVLGRFSDVIAAHIENAGRSEEGMARRVAKMRAEWEHKAKPLRVLIGRLSELREDLRSQNISVEVLDKTNHPVWNEWQPSLEFQLVKLNAIPPRESARFRVRCFDGRYKITSEETSGRDEGRATDIGVRSLTEAEIDSLLLHALGGYPWWLQEQE